MTANYRKAKTKSNSSVRREEALRPGRLIKGHSLGSGEDADWDRVLGGVQDGRQEGRKHTCTHAHLEYIVSTWACYSILDGTTGPIYMYVYCYSVPRGSERLKSLCNGQEDIESMTKQEKQKSL